MSEKLLTLVFSRPQNSVVGGGIIGSMTRKVEILCRPQCAEIQDNCQSWLATDDSHTDILVTLPTIPKQLVQP